MEIAHQKGSNGEFYIAEGEDKLGFLQYHIYNKKLVIDHTEVGEKLKGTGSARKLVEEAIRFAEAEGYEISAECTYAAHVLKKAGYR